MSTRANSSGDRADALATVHETVRVCTRCPLHKGRTHAVPGAGPAGAEIMFIGEAPGFHEDRKGEPFVGQSGQFLNELLASIGIRRQDVYITNVVKCRPPENRDPLPEEITACSGYLDQQLELIRPKVIVTLGRYSMARWFPGAKISVIHGKPKKFQGVLVVPMYHPAAALRTDTVRREIEEDFKMLPELLKQLGRDGDDDAAPAPPAQQLSMF